MNLERLPAGLGCRVSVPGSSANLGPGFDSLGMALAIRDTVEVQIRDDDRTVIEVSGEGEGTVPLDGTHLVARVLRETLRRLGFEAHGLSMRCRNVIPHGRGIGSSAAAIVSGVLAARGLLEQSGRLAGDAAAGPGTQCVSGHRFDMDFALQVATDFEGHPDNAAASLFGSAVVGWMNGSTAHAVPLELHPRIGAVVAIPGTELATSKARAMLPAHVPHADATYVAGRAALLVLALTQRPELLLDATDDRLHQGYRAPAMPETADLLRACREDGLAATVSGAGPSLLVLADEADLRSRVAGHAQRLLPGGWQVLAPGIDRRGAVLTDLNEPAEPHS